MLNGKTRSVTAFAVALLGTTFLVSTSEAHTTSNPTNSNEHIGQPTVKHVKKSVRYKKPQMRRKHYTARKKKHHAARHRHAVPTHRIPYIAPKSTNPVDSPTLNSKTTQRRAIHRVTTVEQPKEPIKCGFLFLSTDCSPETVTQSTYTAPSGSWFSTSSFSTTNVMDRAESMMGMTARGNRRDLVKMFSNTFAKVVDPVRTPWCAAWANAVLEKEGVKGTNSLLARSFLHWGSSTHDPEKGDVVVLARGGKHSASGHVGFLVERTEVNGRRYVKVLGGNQGKSVQMSWYPESKVLGYRRAS